MNDPSSYEPPKVWTWDAASGGKFANINRPVAGATHEKELPVGQHALQLYSLATPNGVKVTILLEELLALAAKVYQDLSPKEIDEIEKISLDRRDFFGKKSS